MQDSDHSASSPRRRGEDSRQSPRRWPKGDGTVQSQSSEVARLRSENRFLYDGSLFFFFLNSFLKFFILKSEGEKKVCKQVGAQTPGSAESSLNHVQVLVPLLPRNCRSLQVSMATVQHQFFLFNFIFQMENGAILW